jgi:hypothetical protein
MQNEVMKRRNFIMITAAGIAAISIPSTFYYLEVAKDNALAHPQSLSQIWDAETIRAIGSGYLKLVSVENDQKALSEIIQSNIEDHYLSFESALEHKIKADFETSQSVMIDGWLLSVTEARQCALFLLTHSN